MHASALTCPQVNPHARECTQVHVSAPDFTHVHSHALSSNAAPGCVYTHLDVCGVHTRISFLCAFVFIKHASDSALENFIFRLKAPEL